MEPLRLLAMASSSLADELDPFFAYFPYKENRFNTKKLKHSVEEVLRRHLQYLRIRKLGMETHCVPTVRKHVRTPCCRSQSPKERVRELYLLYSEFATFAERGVFSTLVIVSGLGN